MTFRRITEDTGMRAFICSLAVLCLCVALFQAAPAPQQTGPASTKPATPASESNDLSIPIKPSAFNVETDDQRFYWQLDTTCVQIVEMYVRPVSRNELLLSALKALYEKAGRPAPSGLPGDLEKAKNETELIALIAKARKDSGRGSEYVEDLLICYRAIATSLDPNTKIVTSEDQKLAAPLQTDSDGFGLEIAPHLVTDALRVTAVYAGGPAQRGGLRPGRDTTATDRLALENCSAAKI